MRSSPRLKGSPTSETKVSSPRSDALKNGSKRRKTINNPPSLLCSSASSSSSSTSKNSISGSYNKTSSTSNSKTVKKTKCCVCAKPEKEETNQFIQCSACQRTYHQFCHFIPVIVIPRHLTKWLCVLCKYKDEKKDQVNGCCAKLVKDVYPSDSRVIKNPRTYENSANFKFEQSCASLKHEEIKKMLKSVQGSLSGCIGNIKCHQHTAQIYTESLSRTAKRYSKQNIPLELIESYEKMSSNKTRCKDILKILQEYILSRRPHEPRIGGKTVACSICYSSVSSEDNKILLCENEGCGRAMHMKCTTPHVTQNELENDPDNTWFCCFCTSFAHLIYYVQVEYEGDEDHIYEEWEDVEDIFVEAENEKALAKKMRKAMDLGEGIGYVWKELMEGVEVEEENEDEDMEEDEEDEDFDPDKNFNYEETDSKGIEDDASMKSNVSLGDISSVDSLSDGEVDTLHLQSKQSLKEKDKGKLDEENILKGKRNRTKVDYRKLNDEIFCDVDSIDIDDEEDYSQTKNSKKTINEKNKTGKDVAQSTNRKRKSVAQNKNGSHRVSASSQKSKDAKPAATTRRKVAAKASPADAKKVPKSSATKAKNNQASKSSSCDANDIPSPKKRNYTKKRCDALNSSTSSSVLNLKVAPSTTDAKPKTPTQNDDTVQSPKKTRHPAKTKGSKLLIGRSKVSPLTVSADMERKCTGAKSVASTQKKRIRALHAEASDDTSHKKDADTKPAAKVSKKPATRASLSNSSISALPQTRTSAQNLGSNSKPYPSSNKGIGTKAPSCQTIACAKSATVSEKHVDSNISSLSSLAGIDNDDDDVKTQTKDTNSFEQPKEVTSIKKQIQDSNPNSSINSEQASNETEATNPNKTTSKKYMLTRDIVSQERTKSTWGVYFKYDRFRRLGTFKTYAMAESALEILRTRLSEESYDDIESIDNLVQYIRHTVYGGASTGSLSTKKRNIVEKDNDKQQNEKRKPGRTKGSPKVSSSQLDHKIQHSLDSIGKRTRLSLTPIGKRTRNFSSTRSTSLPVSALSSSSPHRR